MTISYSPAAAAAKSLQSCPTLCDPIDGSPPGSPVPGILQARTMEWVAISFSNAWKWKVKMKSLSRVRLWATPWTAAYQAPPSTGFSRQEYWSGVPSPSPSYSPGTAKSSEESQFLLLSTWSPSFHSCHTESAVPKMKSSMFSPHGPLYLLFFILGCSSPTLGMGHSLTSFNPWSMTSPYSIWPASLSSILHTYPALALLDSYHHWTLWTCLLCTPVSPHQKVNSMTVKSIWFLLPPVSPVTNDRLTVSTWWMLTERAVTTEPDISPLNSHIILTCKKNESEKRSPIKPFSLRPNRNKHNSGPK